MRLLAPPTPSTDTPGGATSIAKGNALFSSVGCAFCHTSTLTTGNAAIAALRNQPVNLFSDLLIHNMGAGLADGVAQGEAGPANSEPLRSGGSGSGSSSCTTGGRRISSPRF